jgi:hypothetical protein
MLLSYLILTKDNTNSFNQFIIRKSKKIEFNFLQLFDSLNKKQSSITHDLLLIY